MPPRARATASPDEATTPTTEPVPIAVALSRAMHDVGAVGKDGVNSQQGFRFRGVDAVVNAVHPALTRHGVVVMPDVEAADYSTAPTNRGGTVTVVRLRVAYTFYGPAGDSLVARVVAESFDSGDKATAKAMSVAFRTALLQALTLPTDEGDDPDHVTYERAPQPRPAAAQPSRAAAAPAAAPAAPPVAPATVMALRQQVLDAADTTVPGAERDGRLRGLRDAIAADHPGALDAVVPVPPAWADGNDQQVPLLQLLYGARNVTVPSFTADMSGDAWATPAPTTTTEEPS